MWRGAGALLAIGLGLLALSPPAAAEGESPTGKLLLVLDSSGSMREPDASGAKKIDAAKQALNGVVDRLPAGAQVGLRVYGATVFERTDPGACTDSQLVVPIGPADKPALKAEISGYRPYGETPIAYSLKEAAKDVGAEGQRTILLVSDGEETCDPDPCVVARNIRAQGIDLKIDVVGLRVSGAAQRQLKCIADEGGGTYYDAENADELALGLDRLSLRAFRPFTLSGTPVKGTIVPDGAPEIGPGQWTDNVGGAAERDKVKYYLVSRKPGSTVHIALSALPESRGTPGWNDAATLRLMTPDGKPCAENGDMQATILGLTEPLVVTVVFRPERDDGDESCDSQDQFLLEIQRGRDSVNVSPERGRLDYEFLVIEEPPVSNAKALPEAVRSGSNEPVRRQPPSGEVFGGGGFGDAATLTPGTVTDTIQTGEALFYRVKADWGQAPAVSVRLLPDRRAAQGIDQMFGVSADVNVYGPARQPIGVTSIESYHGNETPAQVLTFNRRLPPVRYHNRTSYDVQACALAGYYYFAVKLAANEQRLQVPLEISVAVEGKPSGRPDYIGGGPVIGPAPSPTASPTPSPAAVPTDTPEPVAGDADGDRTVRVAAALGGAGVLLGAGVALGLVLLRRPR